MRKPKSSPESKVKWSLIRSTNNPPFLTWVGNQVPNEQTDGATMSISLLTGKILHQGMEPCATQCFQTDHRMWTLQPFQRLGIESHS